MGPAQGERGRAARQQIVAMFGVGIVAAVAIGFTASWSLAPVGGWAVACVVYILWVWLRIGRLGANETRAHATREEPGRATSELLVLGASLASLAGVAVLLAFGRSLHGVAQGGVAALALASVALSWILIHTLYTLRYARMYYTEPVGGIDFNTEASPRYTDFAYLAFDLGMTFQVADTNLQTSEMRVVVLRHTLLSYLFGSVILASLINLIAGLD